NTHYELDSKTWNIVVIVSNTANDKLMVTSYTAQNDDTTITLTSELEAMHDKETNVCTITEPNAAVFTNKYTPDPVKLVIPVKKVISGDTMPTKEVEFEFEITAADGTPMPNPSTVKVTWDPMEEATSYEIEMKTSTDAAYAPVITTSETAYEFTGLTQGEVKYIHIRAVANITDPSTGASVFSQGAFSDDFGIAPRPDDFSGKVKVTKMARTTITLKWDAVPGALAYAVYYRKPEETKFTYEGETETAGKYKMVGLSGGYDYIVKVIPFAIQESNAGAASAEIQTGTAPTLPTFTVRGGDKTIRVTFKGGRSAVNYKLYYSEEEEGEYKLAATIDSPVQFKVRSIHEGLSNDTSYYVKMTAERTVMDKLLVSESTVQEVETVPASGTSTKPKLYKTKKAFKKAPACKNYKQFKKTFDYGNSFAMPGLINTNAGGFNSTSMVPQSIAAYGNHILIASYDLKKANDSVIYVVDEDNKSLETLILLPHKGHVGGIACDGTNVWLAYGKNMQCFPCSVIEGAIESGQPYIEIYDFTNTVQTDETISYITYYKERIWAGAYDELHSANVYVYRIENKEEKPNLVRTGRMMMPDRTQGLCFSDKGEMIVSRSCQTNKYQRGFMSKIEIYKPSINVNAAMTRGAVKTYLMTPPMNEGIMVSGAYTYVVFESASFSGCEAPTDRVIAFKTSKLVKVKKPKA
ncbi:MAG: fibronectin type III domain-containing protein, partial [Eubacterium sp.]|nr:fibronectin type III domain-containing protein [Eubacterium sp.]